MDKFDYSYSALNEEERVEVEAVQREYSGAKAKQDALSKMRALDKKVRLPAEITAYVLGIIATLVLGVGLCMSMDAISGGVIAGSVIGVIGIVILIFNYKIYKAILAVRKKKYGAEILKITENLLHNEDEKAQ